MSIKVNVINKSKNPLPEYATLGSAGLDLRADLTSINEEFFNNVAFDEKRNTLLIFPKGRCLIPTGLYVELPEGYELQIRPRSGLALREGVTVLNTPGCVDCDYRGEIGVILTNTGEDVFEVKTGDKICQAILATVEKIHWTEVDKLGDTDRGEGGFGHSGKA